MGEPESTRDQVLRNVAAHLHASDVKHPLRVGVDGICGAGKTTFAADLARYLQLLGRHVIHIDSDGFHHIRSIRYRQGRESARGYYEDAYDFDSLRDLVLRPLGPGGSNRFALRVHDLHTDEVIREWASAPTDAIVLFDATFLQRGSLRCHWDLVIYLHARTDVAQARGEARDSSALGGLHAARRAYESRYMAACHIYLFEQRPRQRASIVIDNDDPVRPRLLSTAQDRRHS